MGFEAILILVLLWVRGADAEAATHFGSKFGIMCVL